ncbi:MAG: radical SAM family heme chaperone HemW [Endomicrobium sp.]|jgi:oxygen-independent coproporphyrinogen-3 oxidase|nr:radical SAM family heme chaperone HemW [Endomicrobium sp.]
MLGLYVHIHFCRQKCFYCDFFSVKYDKYLAQKYVAAIAKHALQYKNIQLDTIYIGGGTPSVLCENKIEKLLESINNAFNLRQLKEYTFELNPESASEEKFEILKKYGVNRISVGLQSDYDAYLKSLGRVHNFSQFIAALETAKKVGFENINLDLIYGFPNQTLEQWRHTLLNAVSFDCPHISLYPLSVEENTPFYKNAITTDDDLQRQMYEKACEILSSNGFEHYEISNWAKKNRQSLHNSNYWRNCQYLALGAGASGYFKGQRYKNTADIGKYIAGGKIKTEIENIDGKTFETESIILGLRLINEGAPETIFKNKTQILQELLDAKMLVKEKGRIKLSRDYIFISNLVLSRFI